MPSARLGKGLLASMGTRCLVATQACLRQSTSSRFKWNGTLILYFLSSLFPFFLLPFFVDPGQTRVQTPPTYLPGA